MALVTKSSSIVSVHDLLKHWGLVCQRNADGADGYPVDTILGRYSKDGMVLGFGGTGRRPVLLDLNSELMEQAMLALCRKHPDWALVLILNYVWEQPYRMIERKTQISYRLVRDKIELGRAWLEGYIADRR